MYPWSKVKSGYQRRAGSLLFKRPCLVELKRPLISFSFDDFPRSALLSGGAILKHFGLAGTYYVALGLAGQETASGRMFVKADLEKAFGDGHELGCHTFSHCDSWETQGATFETSIVENRVALGELLPAAKFESFAYPISLPRPLTKARTARYFLCCRGGGQTFNVGATDLNQLSACFLEKYQGDLRPVKELIDLNQRARGWLIFATHDVSDPHTRFGCSPTFLEDVIRYAVHSGAHILPVVDALKTLGVRDTETLPPRSRSRSTTSVLNRSAPKEPLVSILIPAFNAANWIRDTLLSALSQTWEHKEIIVVDDGSTDQTVAIARSFEPHGIRVLTQQNRGAAAARNTAQAACNGDYIQWLDADDLLAPDKVQKQMAAIEPSTSKKVLLSGEFGRFLYQWRNAQFAPTALWQDLSPTDWLVLKMRRNLFMQTATWLVSRELAEASGPWDTRMLSDDDGEYFCRVLLQSDRTRFVSDARVYYRGLRYDSLAYVGNSNKKRDALWLSMQLHVKYLRSLEDSRRTREACLAYLQRNLVYFYPERDDIVDGLNELARDCGGTLRPPDLSWKYSWIRVAFGWSAAKDTALRMRRIRWACAMSVDRAIFRTMGPISPLANSGAPAAIAPRSTSEAASSPRQTPERVI